MGMTAESWTAKKYHPFSKSCHYFCDASSMRMQLRKVPFSVNRGLVFSTSLSPFLMHGGPPPKTTQICSTARFLEGQPLFTAKPYRIQT